LNQKISAGNRQFHLQTTTMVEAGLIRTEVFEKGQVLFVSVHQYERRNTEQPANAERRIRRIVEQFHQSIIEEIDSLFEISDKLIDQNLPSAHEKLGQVFHYLHIFDKAELHFKKAIEFDPERYSSYVYLARVYFLQKRFHAGLEILQKPLAQHVTYPDLYNMLGLIFMEKERYREALTHFKAALQRNPKYIEPYFNMLETILARFNGKLNPAQEAHVKSQKLIRSIIRQIEQHGDAVDRNQCAVVAKALAKNAGPKALALLREFRDKRMSRKEPPEVIGYKFFLRLLYADAPMSILAMENYERQIQDALAQNPAYPDLWHYLGLIHLMQCRQYFLDGLDHFREATRINPQFEKALKNLRLVENDGREFLQMIKSIV
jgi:tetratricopeptide (TPR) repeat protein